MVLFWIPRRAQAQARPSNQRLPRSGSGRASGFRPQLEWLEERALLSFAPAVNYLTGPANGGPTAVVAGQFNQDNNLDLAVANGGTNFVKVLAGNGNGTFSAPLQAIPVGIHPIALAAGHLVAGDSNLDLVVANNGQLLTGEGTDPGSVSVLLGNGDGTFRPGPAFPAVDPSPSNIVLADLNHDGKLDVVVTSTGNPRLTPLPQIGSVRVFLGNGDGTFTPQQTISLTGNFLVSFPTSAAVADFDGDGRPDLAVTAETASVTFSLATLTFKTTYSSTLQVFLGDGTGTFATQPALSTTVGMLPASLATGDFNGDGRPDLVVANNANSALLGDATATDPTQSTVSVLLNQSSPGAVNFTSAPTSPIVVGSNPLVVAVGKLNPDQHDDIIVSNNGTLASPGSTVTVLLGNGTGGFTPDAKSPYAVGFAPTGVALGAFTSTGQQDLAVANSSSGTVSVLLNQAGTRTTISSSANPAVFGQSVTLTAVVSAPVGGSGTPTGTVTFKDGSTILGTGTLTNAGVATFTTSPLQLALGSHGISASYATDGTHASSVSTPLTQTVSAAPATSTTVTSSANPSVSGQAVTFTATVANTGGSGGAPTGGVEFFDGSTDLGAGTPGTGTSASATWTFSTSALAVGSHTIQASYRPSGQFSASNGNLTQTVNPPPSAATSTAVRSSANPAVFGQGVTFTATVTTTGGGVPTGSVEFFDGNTDLGAGTSGPSATWTFTTSHLAVGSHTVRAVYHHTGAFLDSNGSLTQAVNVAPTTTVVTSSANPSVFGRALTFTATVRASAPGSGTPTGTVTFRDGSTILGTGTLTSAGVVTFTTTATALIVGSHAISASYASNGNYAGSASVALTQTVSAVPTTTAVTSSARPSLFGQAVTFTATVAITGGSGAPTGAVEFFDGNTDLGAGTVGHGTSTSAIWTFTTSHLAVGSHTVRAVYHHTGAFLDSNGSLTQTVNVAPTTTVVTSSANPSVFGRALTFTATVHASAPGSGTPIGTVTFKDGSTILGTGTLTSAGVATFTTTALIVGSHAISASYASNGKYAGSTSVALPQTVSAIPTTTAVTSSARPSAFGQVVTFTATVTSNSGKGAPTGAVQFFDGAIPLGTSIAGHGTSTSTIWTFSTSHLAVGSHTIRAVYHHTGAFQDSNGSLIQPVTGPKTGPLVKLGQGQAEPPL